MSLEKTFEETLDIWSQEDTKLSELLTQCVQICDEFAVGFAEWCIDRKVEFSDNTIRGNVYYFNGVKHFNVYTTAELLEIYKQGL